MRRPNSIRVTVSVLVAAVALVGCGASAGTRAPRRSTDSPASSSTPPSTVSRHRATAPPTQAADPAAGRALIDHVHWGATTKGRQLQVFPTPSGRTDVFPGAAGRAWAEVVADAPNAATRGMHDQFLCHWNYARVVDPTKPSWNLEPWRPAVGYAATVAALCNPGGSEG